jgi:predicted ATP-dependent protease
MTTKRVVAEWQIQLIWFLAGVFATGAVWYFLSRDQFLSAGLSAVSAVALAAVAVRLQRINDRSSRFKAHREGLAGFLQEAEAMLRKHTGQRIPAEEHNAWVAQVENYLREQLDTSYIARFNNFSGMTFFSGSGAEKNSIDGRCRRLHEFIKEFSE